MGMLQYVLNMQYLPKLTQSNLPLSAMVYNIAAQPPFPLDLVLHHHNATESSFEIILQQLLS
jgi:hypothetical protein